MGNRKTAVLLLTVLMGSCARSVDEKSSPALNRYSIHGEVMRLSADDKLVTIHHKDIEGYMKSMTMTFPVKDPREFSALQLGNCIEGTLFVQGDSFWVGEIKHLDTPGDQCVPAPPPDPAPAAAK